MVTMRPVRLLAGLPLILAVVLFWQWAVTREPVFFLPAPSRIADRLSTDWLAGPPRTLFLTEQALTAIGQTFATALLGWAVAAVLGVVVGSILGVRRALAEFAGPSLLLLRSVPPVSTIPIAIVILGVGTSMRIAVVVTACIWPILLNATAAVSGVDQTLRDVAALNRLNPVQTFWRVLLPAASPNLFAGLRVGLTLAVVLAVGADMFAGAGGLGGALLASQSTFDTAGLWATLVVLAVMGALVNGLLLVVERFALRWNTQGDNR